MARQFPERYVTLDGDGPVTADAIPEGRGGAAGRITRPQVRELIGLLLDTTKAITDVPEEFWAAMNA